MKKLLSVLFLMFIGISFNSYSHELFSVNNYGDTIYYNITSSGYPYKVAITYKGSYYEEYENEYSGNISIPSTILYNSKVYLVTSIQDNAFRNCSTLTNITLPDSMVSIGVYSFSHCSSLVSVSFNNIISSIGNYAFEYCGLTSVNIPNSVTYLGKWAFYNCSNLSSANLSESLTTLNMCLFRGCSSLSSIIIPNSVTSLQSHCFNGSGLTSVNFGNSVTSIGINAFSFCPNLKYINIPNSVTTLEAYAFQGSNALDSIRLSDNITSIGNYTFQNCSSLDYIELPHLIDSIGLFAFDVCTSLNYIISHPINPPKVSSVTAFSGVSKTIPVYVDCDVIDDYQSAENWSDFTNIRCKASLENISTNALQTTLYPNPTNDKTVLSVEGLKNDSQVMVYDIFGRRIKTYSIKPNQKEMNIDVSGLNSGTYYIICKDNINGLSTTNKLIVQ